VGRDAGPGRAFACSVALRLEIDEASEERGSSIRSVVALFHELLILFSIFQDVFNLDLMAGPDNSPSNYFVRVYQNKYLATFKFRHLYAFFETISFRQTPNAVSVLSVTANGKVRFWPQVNVNAVRNDVFLPLQKGMF